MRVRASVVFLLLGATATTTAVVAFGLVRRLSTADHRFVELTRPVDDWPVVLQSAIADSGLLSHGMDHDFYAEARPIVLELRRQRLFAHAIDLENAINESSDSPADLTALRDLLLSIGTDGRTGTAGRHAADLAGTVDRALEDG